MTNNFNGKSYIGQRLCPTDKTPEEDCYYGSGYLIKAAREKYGIENFSKRILAICHNEEVVDILEKYFIKEYRSNGKAEYNIADGGQGGNLGELVNKRISKSMKVIMNKDEVKEKCSNARRNWWKTHIITEEEHLRRSISQSNKVLTEEHKRHISEGGKGRKLSDENKERISKSLKGRKLSAEHRKCISETRKGTHLSEEHKRKLSVALTGKKRCEHRKIKDYSKTGNHLTSETKSRISDANRGRKYFNNGEIEVMRFECPDGFVPGRCPKAKESISKGMKKF